jgi:spermidine/putrescine transport system ATP-binding protein
LNAQYPIKEPLLELENVAKSYSDVPILYDINLTVYNGEFLTLLGSSGCGKTTLLRLISGFEQPSAGEIFIKGKNIVGLAPHLRDVNTVFQSYALFPHMNVFDNIAFGLHCSGMDKDSIATRVWDMLRTVKLEPFALRKPSELSGGQQQRVAIARALVKRPLVLLLDEPLSSLDYRLRKNMQIELKQLQRELGITFVFVTHDQEEALLMSDRVVVLEEGRIQQIGTPREVYEMPCNLSVAKFIGEANIFDAVVNSLDETHLNTEIEGLNMRLPNLKQFVEGSRIHVLIRPEDLDVWDRTEVTETDGLLAARVEEVIYKGSTVDLMLRLHSGKLIAATEFFDEDDMDLSYTIGESVWVAWPSGWETILPYED